MAVSKERKEYIRLAELYSDIPDNKRELVEGLLVQAARLKVSLDALWSDIQKNGTTEIDDKGKEKERPNSAIFTARDKSYRATIKQLDSLLPAKASATKPFALLNDEDDD